MQRNDEQAGAGSVVDDIDHVGALDLASPSASEDPSEEREDNGDSLRN